MAFTEFACRSGGSNLNAGTRTGNSTEPGVAADLTYAAGTWVNATNTFTVASGNPSTDGVAVGDFVSLYADGSTVTGYIARVTTVGATTIVLSATAKSGTAPTDGAMTRTVKVGGAWQGPNAASGFPMNFLTNTCTNSAGDLPRINYKNAATYSITANITGVGADTCHQGYATSYGDLGRATLDGGTTGASYNLIGTTVGANAILADFICQNNGATGTSGGVFWNSTGQVVRCVFNSFRGSGLQSNNSSTFIQCEAYSCNQSNSASQGGFNFAGQGATLIRCISHDNTGSNNNGFVCVGQLSTLVDCIADSNGLHGFQVVVLGVRLLNCDSYNNGSDGIRFTGGGNILVENCNLTKNGGWGFLKSGGAKASGTVRNCGFGSGTQANASGQKSGLDAIIESGSVTYATDTTPYNAPATGDFRITLAAAKGTGHGSYTQTQASYTGTVGYPDIGAAQHIDSGGGGGIPVARGMHGGMR